MNKNKTYKREVSFALMAFTVLLITASAITGSEHIKSLAELLLPFASALLAGAFGLDWWGKQK